MVAAVLAAGIAADESGEQVGDEEAEGDHHRAEDHPAAQFEQLVEDRGQFGETEQQARRGDREEQDDRHLDDAGDDARCGGAFATSPLSASARSTPRPGSTSLTICTTNG